jgi:adenylate kinase family enzyme
MRLFMRRFFVLKVYGMKNVQRIAIIGNAGSGKSTLARQLHAIFHLPVYHLDQYFWKSGWVQPDPNEYKKIHDALCDKPEWIMDGMNLKLLEYRAKRADIIIFLDFPRYICFWRIFKRTFNYYGRETPSSAAGCSERFDWEFVKFLKWVWNFQKKYPSVIMEVLKNNMGTNKKIYVLKSQKDIDTFVHTVARDI